MTDRSTRIAIVGGGLGGLVLAEQLVRRGASPADLWIADSGDGKRGSDNPGATFHPFPGSSIAPDPRKLDAARVSVATIETWRTRWPDGPIRTFPLVRPLGDDDRSLRLRDSWSGPDCYPDWMDMSRVAGSELGGLDPRLTGWSEAFVYRPAYCIDLGALRRRLIEFLRAEGVTVRLDTEVRRLDFGTRDCAAELSNGRIRVDRVVLAVGRAMEDWFPQLAMECRGGELLHSTSHSGPPLRCAIHAGGHVAPAPGGGLVAGATWWPPAAWSDRTNPAARAAIASECEQIVSDLDEHDPRVWRGTRSGFGDYQPLVGPIPGLRDVYAMGGFGGTALLSIPHQARALAGELLGSRGELRDLSRPDRMGADKWEPSDARFRATNRASS